MRVTEKGQVTIPKHIRDLAGIVPGSEVEFVVEDNEILLRMSDNGSKSEIRAKEAIRLLRGSGRWHGLSTDEIMAETRGPYNDLDTD